MSFHKRYLDKAAILLLHIILYNVKRKMLLPVSNHPHSRTVVAVFDIGSPLMLCIFYCNSRRGPVLTTKQTSWMHLTNTITW